MIFDKRVKYALNRNLRFATMRSVLLLGLLGLHGAFGATPCVKRDYLRTSFVCVCNRYEFDCSKHGKTERHILAPTVTSLTRSSVCLPARCFG